MPHIEESIHIDRPVAEVFAFATTPANQTTIMSNMIDFHMDGPMEKGQRAEGTTRVAGRKVQWTSEVTEFEQDLRVEMRSVDAPMDFHITWQYRGEGDGTHVTFIQDVDSLGSFFGKLADPVVTKMYSRDVRNNLENLKVLCEEADL